MAADQAWGAAGCRRCRDIAAAWDRGPNDTQRLARVPFSISPYRRIPTGAQPPYPCASTFPEVSRQIFEPTRVVASLTHHRNPPAYRRLIKGFGSAVA